LKGESLPSRGETRKSRGENRKSRGESLPSRGENLRIRGENRKSRGESLPSRGENLRIRGESRKSRGEKPMSGGENPPLRGEDPAYAGEKLREPSVKLGVLLEDVGRCFQEVCLGMGQPLFNAGAEKLFRRNSRFSGELFKPTGTGRRNGKEESCPSARIGLWLHGASRRQGIWPDGKTATTATIPASSHISP
jgi:hypothetical protein